MREGRGRSLGYKVEVGVAVDGRGGSVVGTRRGFVVQVVGRGGWGEVCRVVEGVQGLSGEV